MPAPVGNNNALGNDGGRPPLYDDPEKLRLKAEEYFNTPNQKITISGLAYFLGFSSRDSLYDYEKKVEFSDIVKRARLRVEMSYEEKLSNPACTGAIFALKNMNWADKSEIANNVTVTNLSSLHTEDLVKLEQLLSKANAN